MGRPQLYDSNFCFRCKTDEKEKWKDYAKEKEEDLGEIIRVFLNELVVVIEEKPIIIPETRKPRDITPKLSFRAAQSEIEEFIKEQLDSFGSISTKDLMTRFERKRRTVNAWLLEYRENVEPLVFDGGQRVWRRIE